MKRRNFLANISAAIAVASVPVAASAVAREKNTDDLIEACRRGPVTGQHFVLDKTFVLNNCDISHCTFEWGGKRKPKACIEWRGGERVVREPFTLFEDFTVFFIDTTKPGWDNVQFKYNTVWADPTRPIPYRADRVGICA